MARVLSWFRYMGTRIQHSHATAINFFFEFAEKKSPIRLSTGFIRLPCVFWNSLLHDRLTFLHFDKGGKAMEPIIGTTGATLLVRRIASQKRLRIGDVVVYKDPKNLENLLVRRILGLRGSELYVYVIKGPAQVYRNECSVLADNHELSPKEAYDSRTYGPIDMPNILGRVIYSMRSPVDHGPIRNSHYSTRGDSAVIDIELDIDEMKKLHESLHKP